VPSTIGGLGVDIVEIDRMALALRRTPRIKERVFSDEERAYCDARSRPEVHYALRFAAKEAVLKALGTGFSGVRFRDVEVTRDERGRPIPVLHGRAAELAAEAGIRELHLSLSYTTTTAVASAVAISGEEAAAEAPAELTPREQVAAMFKASRGLLDEIDREDEQPDAPEGPEAGQSASRPAGESI
jgi:holo-[acyl-carrier protein] synthase